MASCGATNTKKFLYKKGGGSIFTWLQGSKKKMKVRTIKQFCNTFNIDFDELEQKGILRPNYPIDMYSKGFINLKTHVLNEGRISPRKSKLHVVLTLGYSNQDPVLLKYFADAVKGAGGTRGEPCLETYALVLYASSVLARALQVSGLPFGRKTRSNPSLDPLLSRDPELFRYHIQATLSEEGWCSLRIKGRRARFDIAWGRSVDITDKLSKEQKEQIYRLIEEKGRRKISIKVIGNHDIRSIMESNPPTSFDQEVFLFSIFHKDKELSEGRPTKVHLSKEGRITAFWEIHFTRPDLIDLIHNEYGMLPGTWKAKRLENLYEIYRKYRGRKLTDEEIQKIGKAKEENPHKIPVIWISEKVQELFPGVKWGKDMESIRVKLGRKEIV